MTDVTWEEFFYDVFALPYSLMLWNENYVFKLAQQPTIRLIWYDCDTWE